MEPLGTERLEAYHECLRQRYGDLQDPDYSFVAEVVDRQPYAPLVARLGRLGLMEQWPHGDDDVALCCKIRSATDAWWLWLSYVGPFALLSRDPMDAPGSHNVIHTEDGAREAGLQALWDEVEETGFRFLRRPRWPVQ